MFRSSLARDMLTWLGRGCTIMAVVACLALGGCKNPEPKDQGFAPDPLFDSVGRSRKPDTSAGFDGLSDKSRQIERDMGIR
jgi:hypothetical protein